MVHCSNKNCPSAFDGSAADAERVAGWRIRQDGIVCRKCIHKACAARDLPWKERVSMLSINPDAATRDDVTRLAAEVMAVLSADEMGAAVEEAMSDGNAD